MKKWTPLVVAALAVVALLTGCAGGGTPSAPASAAKVIRAGSTGQSFPGGFKEGDKLVGFDVELLEQAAQRAGYTVEWTNADFAGLMGQLEAGRLDTVANNVAITDARKQSYDFTDIYAYMGTTIVTHKDSAIQSLADLDGKTVAGVLGSNNLTSLQAWADKEKIKMTIRPYETRDGAMQDVVNRRVDGYVQSSGVLLAEIKKENLPLRFVGNPIGVDTIGFPFPKSDAGKALRELINAKLADLRADGSLKKLSEKYYGADVTVPPASA